jgi:hypothetical protein
MRTPLNHSDGVRASRFTRRRRCPICNGHAEAPEGHVEHCGGCLSADSSIAYCSQQALSPRLRFDRATGLYAHCLDRPCQCGRAHHVAPAPRPADASPPVGGTAKSPWARIRTAREFLDEVEPDADFLVHRILARGSLTLWFSPRGLGKTHVSHHLAVKLAASGRRVLLVDRDNSRRELRRRLTGWGARGLATLKVMDRDEAPPLTDRAAWAEFPFGDYDAVIIDAFDSSAEGVGEQDSSRPSLAVGLLLDLAHRASGPAVLVLGNTVKSGSHGRGSGVIEDRADIVFEVRDATDLRPSGSRPWWEELPPADRGSWAERAARRKRRDTYRLAFICSKYRPGEEPEPFALEVRLGEAPWRCVEVTACLREGEDGAQKDNAERLGWAVKGLASYVAAQDAKGHPVRVRGDAVPMLVAAGASRDEARALIGELGGREWDLSGSATRGDPVLLRPLAKPASDEGSAGKTPSAAEPRMLSEEPSIPAGRVNIDPPESSSAAAALGAANGATGFRRGVTAAKGVEWTDLLAFFDGEEVDPVTLRPLAEPRAADA